MHINYNESDTVTRLMIKEVSQTRVLSREDEQILFSQYNSTNSQVIKEQIRNTLVRSNLRFVLKIAMHYNRKLGVDINDIMSEGKLGLIIAVDKFKPSKGVKFISYAVWQIRCKVSKYLEENDLIRLPPNQKMRLNKLRQTKPEYLTEDERIFVQMMSGAKSLDTPIHDESDLLLQDIIPDESIIAPDIQVERNRMSKDLIKILDTVLNEEEKFIITSVFGLNASGESMNLREVNEKIGKSRERVRQIRDRALSKLKKNIEIQELSELLHEVPI
jgi:RNA polymerase primary sigma factor